MRGPDVLQKLFVDGAFINLVLAVQMMFNCRIGTFTNSMLGGVAKLRNGVAVSYANDDDDNYENQLYLVPVVVMSRV